jgi:hypothetical protein
MRIVAVAIALLATLQHGPGSSRARAHGRDPAQALSIVAADAHGPSVVRLNEGLAVRRQEGWRFVCPVLWGEDAVVPAQAIPGGAVLIGASSGLFVMREDGGVVRHADPAATGRVIALATSAAGLYALRAQGAYEVLAVQADTVRVLWSDTRPWTDMAVGEAFVSLMRIESDQLHELRLSPEGAMLAEHAALLAAGASGVRVRLTGGISYALVLSSALTAELGRIEQGVWLSLQDAGTIAGPIEMTDGLRVLALDGALARFDGEQLAPLAEPARVTCLGRWLELGYACSEGDLRALEPDGLGALLFGLDGLLEPDLERVPEAAREACTLQWQRYRIDLLQRGITPRAPDAGVAVGPLDAGAPDAGTEPDAEMEIDVSAEAPDAPAAIAASAVREPPIVSGSRGGASEQGPALDDPSARHMQDGTRASGASGNGHCGLEQASRGSHGGLLLLGVLAALSALRRKRHRRRGKAHGGDSSR